MESAYQWARGGEGFSLTFSSCSSFCFAFFWNSKFMRSVQSLFNFINSTRNLLSVDFVTLAHALSESTNTVGYQFKFLIVCMVFFIELVCTTMNDVTRKWIGMKRRSHSVLFRCNSEIQFLSLSTVSNQCDRCLPNPNRLRNRRFDTSVWYL